MGASNIEAAFVAYALAAYVKATNTKDNVTNVASTQSILQLYQTKVF
jgi:hypothetical protein